MARYNNGLIYTNDLCIGCNKCISSCSILGANVSVKKNNRYVIKVDERKCSNCGKCLNACVHKARSFHDDLDDFFANLKANKNISLIVDSSFFVLYGNRSKEFLGYLKSLGVKKIYSSNIGTELAVWLNVNYVLNNKGNDEKSRPYITNHCSALINQLELFYPFLLRKIIPNHSDLMCTAIYARKYLNDTNEFAVLSPCTAKKDDIKYHDKENLIKYNMIFSKFVNSVVKLNSNQVSAEVDLESLGLNSIVPVLDDLEITYSYFFEPNSRLKRYEKISKDTITELELFNNSENNELVPDIAVFKDCYKGCRRGPGVGKAFVNENNVDLYYGRKENESYKNFSNLYKQKENLLRMNELFGNIKADDFVCQLNSRYKQPPHVPVFTYDEIYKEMYKTVTVKRHIDCGSCGYQSCHDMAKAIAYGYNKKENCIHYMNEEMERRSSIDSQTGLLTKDAFINSATNLIESNPDKTYLICSGDINRFKIIDEIGGSKLGDAILLRIASKLREIVTEEGLCGRLYGGCFVLCFEYTLDNYDNLRSTFRSSDENTWLDFSEYGINFPVTMRFGLCEAKAGTESITEIISCATLARDEKKEINKNSLKTSFTLFTKELKDGLKREAEITAAMKPALKNNEFTLWYQPQYRTNRKKLSGAEALCRWIKPDGTIISPGEFIPLAEKNGFIKELDEYNWKMAFETVRKWHKQGLKTVPISVNISRVSFRDDKLIPVIESLRKEYDDIKDEIHFEITESIDIGDQEKLIERVNTLKATGVKLAMDDFGSGYSSLNTLKDLHIDYLKLDMGFIKPRKNSNSEINKAASNRGEAIIASIIEMAKKINIDGIIAEGVETKDQRDFMQERGCDIIQGYIWGRPEPEEKFVYELKKEEYKKLSPEERNLIFKEDSFQHPQCIFYLSFDIYKLKESLDFDMIEFNKPFVDLCGFEESKIYNWTRRDVISLIQPEDLKNVIMVAIKNLMENNKDIFNLKYNVLRGSGKIEQDSVIIRKIRNDKNSYILMATFEKQQEKLF